MNRFALGSEKRCGAKIVREKKRGIKKGKNKEEEHGGVGLGKEKGRRERERILACDLWMM